MSQIKCYGCGTLNTCNDSPENTACTRCGELLRPRAVDLLEPEMCTEGHRATEAYPTGKGTFRCPRCRAKLMGKTEVAIAP